MSIYPTLCDLCGIDIPKHVEGASIRKLLADPAAAWEQPAITTFGRGNHAVRSEGWRYIRYADGGEELYDETNDPHEWTNLARDARYAGQKAELAALLPAKNVPEVERSQKKQKKARRQARKES
jgi:arylsulfatase A-like enzyme